MALYTESSALAALQYRESIENEIVKIFAPLKRLGITHSSYLRGYKDGTYLMICNDLSWNKIFITNNLADRATAFAENMQSAPFGKLEALLWPPSKGNDCLSLLHENNIWNGIDLFVKYEDYIEGFFFATKPENTQIFNLYLNRLDLLIKFGAYFKEKAAHLFDVKDSKILAKQTNKVSLFTEATAQPTLTNGIDIESFVNETPVSRYDLNENVQLTKREMECLWHLSRGQTSKEIGKILNSSPRTIESHIANLKVKTSTQWKSQLIDLFLKSPLRNIYKDTRS